MALFEDERIQPTTLAGGDIFGRPLDSSFGSSTQATGKSWLKWLSVSAALVATWEVGWTLHRFGERTKLYGMALARARQLGKPLVVIGDPDGGLMTRLGRAYGCGDLCADLHGCPGCPQQVAVDLMKDKAIPLADNSAVVFVSCVLEYVDNTYQAYNEIRRVAGDNSNIFVVRVEPWTLTTILFHGARWVIDSAPPYEARYSAHRVTGLFDGDGH